MTGPQQGSFARAVFGTVFMVASVVAIAMGFVQLTSGLQGAGYGSPEVRRALTWMSIGGAVLAIGMCLLIWEVSIRYGIRK